MAISQLHLQLFAVSEVESVSDLRKKAGRTFFSVQGVNISITDAFKCMAL
jgi:hypothetical protein